MTRPMHRRTNACDASALASGSFMMLNVPADFSEADISLDLDRPRSQSISTAGPWSINHFVEYQEDEVQWSASLCGVCRQILGTDAVQTECDHLFCTACWQVSRSSCAACGYVAPSTKQVSDKTVSRLRNLERAVVKCLNEDCGWQGSFGAFGSNLAYHLRTCNRWRG